MNQLTEMMLKSMSSWVITLNDGRGAVPRVTVNDAMVSLYLFYNLGVSAHVCM